MLTEELIISICSSPRTVCNFFSRLEPLFEAIEDETKQNLVDVSRLELWTFRLCSKKRRKLVLTRSLKKRKEEDSANVGYSCSGKLVNVPMTTMECSAEDEEANYKVIDRLEELDDVESVEHNMAVS